MNRRLNRNLKAIIISCLVMSLMWTAGQASAEQNQFTLQQCIDRALDRNVGIIGSRNAYKQSGEDVLEAWGDALPSLSTSAGYGFRRTYGLQPFEIRDTATGEVIRVLVPIPDQKSYGTRVDLRVNIFNGGATWFNILSQNKGRIAAENDLMSTLQSTAYNVKQAYYGLLSAKMLKKTQRDALTRSKKQLEVVTSRYELGSASLSEKLKAQVNMANDSLLLLERENDIKKAEFNLNLLMNRDVMLPLQPLDSLTEPTFSMSLSECYGTALEDNPALRKTKANYDAAQLGVRTAQSSWLPRVDASMAWDWRTLESDRWFKYSRDDRSYSFGVSISYDLFDAFRKKTVYSRARLSSLTLRETYDAEKNSVAQMVKRAYIDIEKSKLQLATAVLAEQSAEEDMKLQQERYRLGASSILELLDAQYSLTNAQYSKVRALYELNLAIASMAVAMGRQ